MFVSFFSSPGALGRSIKACPTPSSSIRSSCLPLLCEVGKSQFILPLVSSVGRTVFLERAVCILPPLSSVTGVGCETGHRLVSLPAVVLSKAPDARPALSNQCPGTSPPIGSSAMLLLHYWHDEELPCLWTDPLGSPFSYKQIPTAGPPKCPETPSLQTLEVHRLLGHATASAFEKAYQVGPCISWGPCK